MKILIYLSFFILTPYFSFSQLTFSVKAGMNMCKAKYLDEADEELIKPYRKLKPGIISGLVLTDQFSEKLGAQIELLYSQKGLKSEQAPYNKTVNTMNYLEMPLTGFVTVADNGYTSLNIQIGGYASYWLYGRYKYENLITGETESVKVDFNNEDYRYNRLDAGVFAGILVQFEKSSVFLRYTHSMSSSSETNADALTNRLLSLGVNIKILAF